MEKTQEQNDKFQEFGEELQNLYNKYGIVNAVMCVEIQPAEACLLYGSICWQDGAINYLRRKYQDNREEERLAV